MKLVNFGIHRAHNRRAFQDYWKPKLLNPTHKFMNRKEIEDHIYVYKWLYFFFAFKNVTK